MKGAEPGGVKAQYAEGFSHAAGIDLERYTLDAGMIARSGNLDVQLDLFLGYANNVKLHLVFQEYFRSSKAPLWLSGKL